MLSKKRFSTALLVLAALSIAPPASAADPKKGDTKSAADKAAADKAAADKAAADKAAADKAAADKAAADKAALPEGSPAALAKAAYDKGVDLANQKDFKGAEESFLTAWKIQKSYDVAANLGVVEDELGKATDAAFYFTYALKSFPASGSSQKRDWLEARVKEARAKVASVTLDINIAGADVKIDGKSAGKAPLEDEQLLVPGEHTIEVSAADYQSDVQSLKLVAGATRTIKITLTPPPKSLLPAFVAGGVGVAALVAGVALSVVSTSKYDEAKGLNLEITKDKGSCAGGSPHAKCADLKSAAELSDALYTPGLALVIGGAVLTAAGGAYFGYTLRTTAPPPAKIGDKPASGPRVTTVGVRGPGVFLQGTF